jgi:hypothetical protein
MLDNGSFDPELCPLLKGLSPEEIAARMSQQPIASCRKRLETRALGTRVTEDSDCPAMHPDAGMVPT